MTHVHDAERLELLQCFANGWWSDAEAARHLEDRRQAVALGVVTALDHAADATRERVRERIARDAGECVDGHSGVLHRLRNASTAGTPAARRAGIQLAASTASTSMVTMPNSVSGSVGSTPYSSERSTRVVAKAPARPHTIPATASANPWPTTSLTTSRRVAPSATRTPISTVRCATPNEITPYVPIAASSSASPAKAPSSMVMNRGCAVAEATRASIVATS